MPGNAESSSGATAPTSDSGNRSASTPAKPRHRVSNRARVSRASASSKPPPVSASSANTRVGDRSPVGVTVAPSTSPVECAWSVDTMSTRRPLRAARTAVAVANVDLPTPPLPTNRLTRAGTGESSALSSLHLDSLLEILQRGVGQPAFSLALEQPDHRDDQVDGQLVGHLGAG